MEIAITTSLSTAPARQTVVSPDYIIATISAICEARHQAYSYYPYATGPEKWEAIKDIRFYLREAKMCLNWRQQIKMCLRTELSLHVIADRRTTKRLKSYRLKVDTIMNSCREALRYQKQA